METKVKKPRVKKKRSCSPNEDDKGGLKKCKSSNLKEEPSSSSQQDFNQLWEDFELLAENEDLSTEVARVTIKLFEEGNTIPFIARYRKDAVENLSADKLRDIKDEYDKICSLKARSQTVLKSVEKSGKLSSVLKAAILSARSNEELEHIYAPYKSGTKRTLAERAKVLGLENPALELLNGSQHINLESYVEESNKELSTVNDVEKGIMHIIASIFATDTEVLSVLRQLRAEVNFMIETKKSKAKKEKNSKIKNTNNVNKFAVYFGFTIPKKYIKPHQILAINRGEALNELSVKIIVPDLVYYKFSNFCVKKWANKGQFNNPRKRILDMSIKDAYTRLVQPYIIREVRSELKAKAEKASHEVFATNLKQLLLMPPLKGRILGIDPGFKNGCKIGVITETGSILATAIIYPCTSKSKHDEDTLKSLIKTHNCKLIALGNGTACRETEVWLTELLEKNTFAPLDVTYTIVNESGASIYSCGEEAKKEFPELDPNLISAISLARRIQDPLAELVKVEPKHLGVGMYQHDVPKKQLEQALADTVMECVSFVGINLNTASQCLLRRVAGLTDKRASAIIEYREKKGLFKSRKELLDVKGIGAKVFEQCAGFLRIGPAHSNSLEEFYNSASTNRLDCTYIHPESYSVAVKIIDDFDLDINNIGKQEFIDKVKSTLKDYDVVKKSVSLTCSVETINLILDALSKPLNFDMRSECSQVPLFKKGVMSMSNLSVGSVVTGSINNVTHFGCFVDIGVGQDGLVHQSNLKGFNPQIGDHVEVKVLNIEIDRKRIALEMIRKL